MSKAALAGLSPLEQLLEQTTPLEDVLFIEAAYIWRAGLDGFDDGSVLGDA